MQPTVTKRVLSAAGAAVVGGLLSFTTMAQAPIPIVDTLGAATTTTHFSIFGTASSGVLNNFQIVGPQFTLTQPTVITEIGGFLNSCSDDQCTTPSTHPLSVQIRPSTDLSTVLASFTLSNDANSLVYSYESVALNLTLQAGTYFALFASQGDNTGFLLASANSPFDYEAGLTTLATVNPVTGTLGQIIQDHGAVRIWDLCLS